MQRYSSSVLDDILNQALESRDSSISSSELKLGASFEKKLLRVYLMKLIEDNYINSVDANENIVLISLTKRGKTFIENRGYNKQVDYL